MSRMRRFLRTALALSAAMVLALVSSLAAFAANGTWTNLGGGDYNTPGNWTGGTVGSGAGFTADFSTVNIASDVQVTLNSDLTIGHLKFGDTNTATGGSWELRTDNTPLPTITLDNAAGTPTITVNPLVPATTFDDAFIAHNIAGTAGFTKLGGGILTLGAGTANTITGGINVNEGTLRLAAAVPAQAITLADGTTLQTAVSLDGGTGHTINVASGATANIVANATVEFGNFNAAGATLNFNLTTAGSTLTADGNWAVNGGAAAVSFSSTEGGFIRLRPNSGSPNFNTANAFQNAHVNLDNVTMWTRTNSGGNDVNIGALSGTATAVLSGGAQGGGTAPRYFIGSLNTDTEYAGAINDSLAATLPTPHGGVNLIKVGTGKLTLSGTINNAPQVTGTSAATDPTRRGGVTQIQNGVLALTNSATITGGVNDPTVGIVMTTIDVQATGTLDVTGYTAGTYQTQALQQIVGAGQIVGNWAHPDGFIRPGNTVPNFSANTTAVAGTITFNNNLNINGGNIGYDMSLNPATGNDLIQVNGSATITDATIVPNFFSGIPSSGTYTVLTATGGITMTPGGVTVDFPGRGADPVAFVSGNSLQFTASGGGGSANLVWRGNNAANPMNWDVESTQNWGNNGANDVFFNLDNVTFNDTAANTNVVIQVPVNPASIVINNATTNYSFTGTGSITGTTGLTKTGAGNLTIQTGNNFNGPASIQGGTLDIGTAGSALGLGPLSLNGVNVVAGVGFNNTSLAVSNGVNVDIAGGAGSGGTYNVPTLSGSGALTLSTSIADKWVALNGTGGFSGTINIGDASQAGAFSTVRLTTADGGTNFGNAVVNLLGASVLANRQGAAEGFVANFPIGELHATDPASVLNAFIGGSPAVDANWVIGGLNTSSDFAGTIINGAGSNATTSVSNLTKIGTGEFVHTGLSTYTGDTAVFGGTLRITSPYLADAGLVRINTGGTFHLDFAGPDTIGALILNGVSATPGEWGAPGSGAPNTSNLLAGTGTLLVTAVAHPGDFDGNGVVDAADLAQWQGDVGINGLSDADGDFDSDGNDFMIWQRNLGKSAPPAVAIGSAVPEPATAAAAAAAWLAAAASTRRRMRRAVDRR